MTNEYLKLGDIKTEEELKKSVDIIKKEDPVLGEKLHKFYEKTVELDRISEDIVKYVLDADKISGLYDKTKASLKPLEQKVADIVKKFEVNHYLEFLVHLLVPTTNDTVIIFMYFSFSGWSS